MNLRYFVLFVLLWLPICLAADESPRAAQPLPEPPQAAQFADDVQDLLYLGDERPVVVRLHIRVEQASFREMWGKYVQQLFKDLDRDGDGSLSTDEISRIPNSAALNPIATNPAAPPQLTATGTVPAPGQSIPAGTDAAAGKFTVQAFDAHLRRTSGGPFVSRLAASGSAAARSMPAAPSTGGGDAASDNLFRRLDRDAPDGKLSVGELQNASRVLHQLDLDDDETISRGELQPVLSAFFVQRTQVTDQMLPAFAAPFVALNTEQPTAAIVRRVIEHYRRTTSAAKLGAALGGLGALVRGRQAGNVDANSEALLQGQKLSQKQIGLPDRAFQRIDTDGDGELDLNEMTNWLRNPVPMFEVALQIGAQNRGDPAVRIIHDGSEGTIDVRTSADGWIVVAIGAVQFEIGAGNRASFSVKDFYKMQFQAADADKNNYLEKTETQRSGFFASMFDAADLDKDGKLYERELGEFLDHREAAVRNRVELTISDQGRNLFEILDVNRDRRLGPLELAGAASRILPWDADKDGCVSMHEVPRHYRLAFGRGQPGIPGLRPIVGSPDDRAPAMDPAPTSGPTWFLKMDRNRDGGVSQREFLGTREQFTKLDSNGDGMIDSAESLGTEP